MILNINTIPLEPPAVAEPPVISAVHFVEVLIPLNKTFAILTAIFNSTKFSRCNNQLFNNDQKTTAIADCNNSRPTYVR